MPRNHIYFGTRLNHQDAQFIITAEVIIGRIFYIQTYNKFFKRILRLIPLERNPGAANEEENEPQISEMQDERYWKLMKLF
jgi:hypothetical protein